MTTFDDKEKGYESKFAHDQEIQFKINARRNKLLGLWAAEKLHLRGADAEAYAKEVVLADFHAPGDDDVLHKVLKDMTKAGIAITDKQIREQMVRLLEEAKKQIMHE